MSRFPRRGLILAAGLGTRLRPLTNSVPKPMLPVGHVPIIERLVANLVDLGILAALARLRGWPVPVFALAGLFISVFYVAPPLRLKHHGLGEPGVALVWGPLMIGGGYFAISGDLSPAAFAASRNFCRASA